MLVLRVPDRLAARGFPRGSRALSAGVEAPAEDADAEVVAGPGGFAFEMADADPSMHRTSDAGKVFRLYKEALKEKMPEGLCGLMHQIMFGPRREYVPAAREKWWDMMLKNKPGYLIRKQSVELISALNKYSQQGTLTGKPAMSSHGFLLDGAPGTGKSMILNHVVHWARATGQWLVVFVPAAGHLTQGFGFYERGENAAGEDTILQPAYAQTILEQMLLSNEDKLKKIEVALPAGATSSAADAIAALLEMKMEEREEAAVDTLVAVMDALRTQTKFPLLIAIDEINALCGITRYPTSDGTQYIPASQVRDLVGPHNLTPAAGMVPLCE